MGTPILGPPGGVDEQKIRPSIAVVIEKRHPAAHGFWKVLTSGSAVDVLKVDTCRLGDVGKLDGGDIGPTSRPAQSRTAA